MATQNAQESPGKRQALGRGLASLFPPAERTASEQSTTSSLRQLPIERLVAAKTQPRRHFATEAIAELAQSIAAQGVLQPILVRRIGRNFEIIAGERRWRAAGQAGLREVPAIVRDLTDAEAAQVALVENLQREDLNPLEEALAFRRLNREFSLSHEAIGQAVGKSRPAITNSLRLLQLPEPVLAHLADRHLTPGHVRALMALPTAATMVRVAEELVSRCASVREAEVRVRQIVTATTNLRRRDTGDASGQSSPPAGGASANQREAETALQRALGAKVSIAHSRGRGQIQIDFANYTELEALIERLLGQLP